MPNSLDMLNGNGGQRNLTDTILNLAAFNPHATLPETTALNNVLVEGCKNDVNWWEVILILLFLYSKIPAC